MTALAKEPEYANQSLADGTTVEEHLEAWTDHLEYRMREWARKGLFGEFGKAEGYAMAHIALAISIRDFPSSVEMRRIADDLLTLRIADGMMTWAGHCLSGVSALRSYKLVGAI